MDSNTAVMSRDYGTSNMSNISLSSSVECIAEGSRMDGSVKLKPKKNDSLPRFFRRKKTETSDFCMASKEELKPESSRTNSLGRRIHYRIAQLRNPVGAPVETIKSSEAIEVKKGGLRGYLSGYWSSIFKKTPRDSGDIAEPQVEGTIVDSAIDDSTEIEETIPVERERIPEIPKSLLDEPETLLEKTVKSTTHEVYVG